MYRYFSYSDSYRYIDVLDLLLNNYNNYNSFHRSIKTEQINVKKEDENKIFHQLYKYKKEGNNNLLNIKYKIGDKVRVSKFKKTFEKGYTPNFTIEIFFIDKIIPTQPVSYLLKDYFGEEISGSFYEKEIERVTEPTSPTYRIEQIIKTKKEKNQTKYLVKWLGWPDKFNSWINQSDLK